jgi:hypothetical protein
MTTKVKILLIILGITAVFFGRHVWLKDYNNARQKSDQKIIRYALSIETEHYAISSNATAEQTSQVAASAESFYQAYSAHFSSVIDVKKSQVKHKLVLYKNQQEFKTNNKSSSWAEAYYLNPSCYAYYSEGQANPYHWMIHEATHQLNTEMAHFKKAKWIDEGLATYFGTSKIQNQRLIPGKIDGNTYPIWWLSSFSLSGNLQGDIDKQKIIPLQALISGRGGPDINSNVNLYYIEYWSLSHFLFHYKSGRYAEKYKRLIVQGGTLENFEKIIGPIDQIQNEWYEYLQQKISEGDAVTQSVIIVD